VTQRPRGARPVVTQAGKFIIIHEESFREVGLSSNVYALESDGRFYLFDASGHPDLVSFLKPAGIPPESVEAVFLTHGHADHVAGLKSLSGAGVDAFIGKEDAPMLGARLGDAHVRELEEGAAILGALGIEPMATPGHSPGSTCFYQRKESLLISGDTVFADGCFGRTDLPGGSESAMIASLRLLCGLGVESILPGHGQCVLGEGRSCLSAALTNATYLLGGDPDAQIGL
jgi:glyoxylase-like metal-dependent hydrolase (beta-lactamase superfamily II)